MLERHDRMYKKTITLPIPILSTFKPLSALNKTSDNEESSKERILDDFMLCKQNNHSIV